MKKFVPIIIALLAAATLAADLPRIAVYVTGDFPDNEKQALGTQMLSALVNSGRYRGIERSAAFLAELEREHITQRSGAIDDDQISELGKRFGVKYICIADVTPALGAFQVSARIINIETAEVDFIGEAHGGLKTMTELARISDEVVRKMFGIPDKTRTGPAAIFHSAGIGGFFSSDFGGGLVWSDPPARIEMPYNGWGVYMFVDIKYVEFFAGFSSGSGHWKISGIDSDSLPDMRGTYINFGAFVKYPVPLSEKMQIYPLLGVDYEMSVRSGLRYPNGREIKFNGGNHPDTDALSALWLKVGGGAEVSLGHDIFLRPEILYGIRNANAYEKHEADIEKSEDRTAKPRLGHGLTLRLGGGFRF